MNDLTWGQWLEQKAYSDRTREAYMRGYQQFAAWLSTVEDARLKSGEIDDGLIKNFCTAMLQAGRSAATINAYLSAINAHRMVKGLAPTTVKKHPLPRLAPKSLSPAEQGRLERYVRKAVKVRDAAIVLLFLNTGLRLSELAALNCGDFKFHDGQCVLTVRCGKGSKTREIPLN